MFKFLSSVNKTKHTGILYHIKVMHCFGASDEVPYEDIAIMACRQHDARVIGMRLQNKHLGLMTLWDEEKCIKLHIRNARYHQTDVGISR